MEPQYRSLHTNAKGFPPPGTGLGPVRFTVSAAANERYWRHAGVAHAALRAGALYPPIAANLTVLLTQTVVPGPLIHTAQRLVCHRGATAGMELTVTGALTRRFTKRGREHAVVEALITLPDDDPLWTSTATFVAAPGRAAPDAERPEGSS